MANGRLVVNAAVAFISRLPCNVSSLRIQLASYSIKMIAVLDRLRQPVLRIDIDLRENWYREWKSIVSRE